MIIDTSRHLAHYSMVSKDKNCYLESDKLRYNNKTCVWYTFIKFYF